MLQLLRYQDRVPLPGPAKHLHHQLAEPRGGRRLTVAEAQLLCKMSSRPLRLRLKSLRRRAMLLTHPPRISRSSLRQRHSEWRCQKVAGHQRLPLPQPLPWLSGCITMPIVYRIVPMASQ